MATKRNPNYEKLSTQELKEARRAAMKQLLNDPRTSISSDDPVYRAWSDLCNEIRYRQALA